MDLLIIPALVQGEGAPLSLVKALSAAEKIKDLEMIVLARGGGSAEDLWAFNDEALVRAIAKTSVPVISAVGHQVDFTLCDFAADFRAETPTAAAETLTQPQTELMTRLTYCQQQLNSRLKNSGQHLRLRKEMLHPRAMLMVLNRKLFEAEKKISILSLKDRMNKLVSLEESQQILDECFLKMNHAIKIMVSLNTEKILRADQVLKALNPKLVLKRGYTYISSGNEEIVASGEDFDKVSDGQNLNIHFHDGVRSVRR
jgi:exodeoxyribonuclease VII large subunit